MARRKHLRPKKDRVKGRCQFSIWGPFCHICMDRARKEMFKGVDVKAALDKLTDEDLKRIREKAEAEVEKRWPKGRSASMDVVSFLGCGFCSRPKPKVRYLIVRGPLGPMICDECVKECADILAEKTREKEDHVKTPVKL